MVPTEKCFLQDGLKEFYLELKQPFAFHSSNAPLAVILLGEGAQI